MIGEKQWIEVEQLISKLISIAYKCGRFRCWKKIGTDITKIQCCSCGEIIQVVDAIHHCGAGDQEIGRDRFRNQSTASRLLTFLPNWSIEPPEEILTPRVSFRGGSSVPGQVQ